MEIVSLWNSFFCLFFGFFFNVAKRSWTSLALWRPNGHEWPSICKRTTTAEAFYCEKPYTSGTEAVLCLLFNCFSELLDILRKWCLITELCISSSCKMALRWAPCSWGADLTIAMYLLPELVLTEYHQKCITVFLKVLQLFLCYMELQEWLHCLLQWKCLLRWRSFSFVRRQTGLVVHLALGLYAGPYCAAEGPQFRFGSCSISLSFGCSNVPLWQTSLPDKTITLLSR